MELGKGRRRRTVIKVFFEQDARKLGSRLGDMRIVAGILIKCRNYDGRNPRRRVVQKALQARRPRMDLRHSGLGAGGNGLRRPIACCYAKSKRTDGQQYHRRTPALGPGSSHVRET